MCMLKNDEGDASNSSLLLLKMKLNLEMRDV